MDIFFHAKFINESSSDQEDISIPSYKIHFNYQSNSNIEDKKTFEKNYISRLPSIVNRQKRFISNKLSFARKHKIKLQGLPEDDYNEFMKQLRNYDSIYNISVDVYSPGKIIPTIIFYANGIRVSVRDMDVQFY